MGCSIVVFLWLTVFSNVTKNLVYFFLVSCLPCLPTVTPKGCVCGKVCLLTQLNLGHPITEGDPQNTIVSMIS